MMNVTYCADYEAMSRQAATLFVSEITKKKNLLLCAATGNSPTGLYEQLARRAVAHPAVFEQLRLIKLDEWGGLPEHAPETCEFYLQKKLVAPLRISPERYISFQSNPIDAAEECCRIQAELDNVGPIDVCVLGLGKNGHLGFNEPSAFLHPHCHIAQLSEQSLQHSMVQSAAHKPLFGLTLGMKDILSSKKIILLISGTEKEEAVKQLFSEKITTELPASLLWLHNNVECLVDQQAVRQ